ncbi:HSP20-like chaperone [Mycena leptocephala]|nr:HSP20-like chaperone [Mycena leptocephala]
MSVFHYDPFYHVECIIDLRPKMDLHEDSEADIVTATFEFPGLKKEDVEINVHDGRLTVTAESKISDHYEKDGYVIRERRFGKYARTLHLPHGVRETEVKASMDNGILTVIFPNVKSSVESTHKKIAIA